MGKRAQQTLAKQGRLADVTLPSLLDAGARSFGWIHPLEFETHEMGETPNLFGAFCYTGSHLVVII